MPRICTVCAHPERKAIEEALVTRQPFRVIACQHDVGRESLRRHAREHLPELLAKAHFAEEASRADYLLEEIRKIKERTEKILERVEPYDPGLALRAIREMRGNLELLARLAGELREAPQVQVNIMASEEWLTVRGAMVEALQDYPQARAAVATRLLEIEEEQHSGGS